MLTSVAATAVRRLTPQTSAAAAAATSASFHLPSVHHLISSPSLLLSTPCSCVDVDDFQNSPAYAVIIWRRFTRRGVTTLSKYHQSYAASPRSYLEQRISGVVSAIVPLDMKLLSSCRLSILCSNHSAICNSLTAICGTSFGKRFQVPRFGSSLL